MRALAVPHDLDAERQLAGGVVSNPVHGRGFELVTVDHFYAPNLARVFGARSALVSIQFVDDRIARAAEVADVPEPDVARLVRGTAVMFDFSRYARRVADAAPCRVTMMRLAEAFNALGSGVPLDDVRPLLAEVAA